MSDVMPSTVRLLGVQSLLLDAGMSRHLLNDPTTHSLR